MQRMTPLTWILVVVGLAFLAVGIVYATITAPDLPSFWPGHVDHAFQARHYSKRAILSFVLAVFAFVGAFLTRSRSAPPRADAAGLSGEV